MSQRLGISLFGLSHPGWPLPANTKHLHNICTMSAQRLRRWSNIVQLLYKCFVFAGLCITPVYTCNHCRIHSLIVSYQLLKLPRAGQNLCIIILVDTSCRWQVFVNWYTMCALYKYMLTLQVIIYAPLDLNSVYECGVQHTVRYKL